MSDEAEYHRTFIRIGDYHPPTKRQGGFRDTNYPTNMKEVIAAKAGAFNAYRTGAKGSVPIRLMPKIGQNFDAYATEWENTYSTLTANWHQRVEPLVDDKLKLVGHIGWWPASEILIPATEHPGPDFQGMIDNGAAVFADKTNPLPTHYRPNYFGKPEWKFLLVTAPDGRVTGVMDFETSSGATATIAPWEAISIGRAAISVIGTGRRYIVDMVMRKGRQRAVAIGPTKELAAAATKGPAAAESGTIHSVHVGTFGTPGHLIARIELEQGKVVYRVASVHLKAEGKAIELKARAAHREMIKRAAQEAQKRGQKEFTLRGIDANTNFQAHANKLADEIGVAGSGKTLPGSAAGFNSYEVTLDAAKALAPKQAVANTASQAARGATGGQSAGRTAGTAAARQGGRPVGRISSEEMEAYLLDVLARRQDLRRLMAARTLTGDGLHQEVRAILKEWEFAQNWSVKYVQNGAAQAASGRTGNLLWMNKAERTLMIERQAAQNPQVFFDQVRHELVAHSLGGGHGTAVAFIQSANGQIWNAQVILEAAVQRGDLGAALRFFVGG